MFRSIIKIWFLILILSQTALFAQIAIMSSDFSDVAFNSGQFDMLQSDPLVAQKFTGTKNVTTFVGPDSANSTIVSYLRSAKKSIHLEIYTISNYFLLQELYAAKTRNTSIDITVLISYNQASGFDRANAYGAAYNLTQSGISTYLSSSSLYFTHAKFWIIDGITTFVYSGNWAKTSVPPSNDYGNREWGLAINDLEVSQYYEDVFAQDLSISNFYVLDSADEKEMTLNIQTGSYQPQFTAQNFVEEMTLQPIFSPDNSETVIRGLLQSANTSIYIEQQYIKTTGVGDLLQDLIDAKDRGVDVKVIVEGRDTDDATAVSVILLTQGIPLVYIDTRLEWCHNKGIIIDGKITVLSSINWSYQSVYQNREAGIVIYSTNITNNYKDVFDYDWAHGDLQESSTSTPTSTTTSTTVPPPDIVPFLILLFIIVIVIVVGGIIIYYVFIERAVSLERD